MVLQGLDLLIRAVRKQLGGQRPKIFQLYLFPQLEEGIIQLHFGGFVTVVSRIQLVDILESIKEGKIRVQSHRGFGIDSRERKKLAAELDIEISVILVGCGEEMRPFRVDMGKEP